MRRSLRRTAGVFCARVSGRRGACETTHLKRKVRVGVDALQQFSAPNSEQQILHHPRVVRHVVPRQCVPAVADLVADRVALAVLVQHAVERARDQRKVLAQLGLLARLGVDGAKLAEAQELRAVGAVAGHGHVLAAAQQGLDRDPAF